MNIFLSYSSSHRDMVESVCYELQAEGHEVFFDKEDLPPGQGYNERIRSAIEDCDLFIFMITPESVTKGKYTLTELKIAIRKWPNPAGHVLPVMLQATSFDDIPAYLKSVTVLSPEGNLSAEIAIEITCLQPTNRDDHKKPENEPDLSQLSYLPLEIRFEAGLDGKYPISIKDSPAGNIQAQPCPFDPKVLEQLLQAPTSRLNETLRLSQKTQGEVQELLLPSLSEAKIIGEQLYQLLFTSPLQSYLKNSLSSINPQLGQGLRFLINTTETPDLTKLPWEFLYNLKQDDFLFTDIMKPVVRWLDVEQPLSTLLVKSPLRLLIIIASPTNRPELSINKELSQLDDALQEIVDKGQIEIVRLEHATLELLDSALLQHKPHILHFIGHGDFSDDEGMIILEAKTTGQAESISGRRLAILLRNHLGSLRFVFLNSCLGATLSEKNPFGGVAQSLIQRGIPAVIAMQFSIPDRAAVSLARHFYRYLAAGQPVDAAITSSRAFLFAKGFDVEWAAPALYMRTTDGRLFDIDSTAIGQTPTLDLPMGISHKGSKRWLWLLLLFILSLLAIESVIKLMAPEAVAPPPPATIQVPIQSESPKGYYQDALAYLTEGNTQEAINSLSVAKQKDKDLQFLDQNQNLRTQLVNAIAEISNSAFSNGDFELASSMASLLRDIEPSMYQALQKQIVDSIETANLIDNLTTQVKSAISEGKLEEAQNILNQLQEIEPNNIQAAKLQQEIIRRLKVPVAQTHHVISGDTLWAIADTVSGDPTLWPLIFGANRDKIETADIIYPGQKLIFPSLAATKSPQIQIYHHRVKKGESLWQIASVIYDDPYYWTKIYRANRGQIQNPDRIFPNQNLIIPDLFKP